MPWRSSLAIASSSASPSCSRRESRSWRRQTWGSVASWWASSSAARSRLTGGYDAVDQADPLGLLGVDLAPGEDQVQRPAGADQPGQPDRAAVDERDPPAAAEDPERWRRWPRPAGRTRSRARGHRRRRTPRSAAITGLPSRIRVGPIGPSPDSCTWLPRSVPIALRSAPAQKVPPSPYSTATLAPSSASKARNASASAGAVGPSTALRACGRCRTTVVTGPSCSTRTALRAVAGHGGDASRPASPRTMTGPAKLSERPNARGGRWRTLDACGTRLGDCGRR